MKKDLNYPLTVELFELFETLQSDKSCYKSDGYIYTQVRTGQRGKTSRTLKSRTVAS
jgi:hypothetical protein